MSNAPPKFTQQPIMMTQRSNGAIVRVQQQPQQQQQQPVVMITPTNLPINAAGATPVVVAQPAPAPQESSYMLVYLASFIVAVMIAVIVWYFCFRKTKPTPKPTPKPPPPTPNGFTSASGILTNMTMTLNSGNGFTASPNYSNYCVVDNMVVINVGGYMSLVSGGNDTTNYAFTFSCAELAATTQWIGSSFVGVLNVGYETESTVATIAQVSGATTGNTLLISGSGSNWHDFSGAPFYMQVCLYTGGGTTKNTSISGTLTNPIAVNVVGGTYVTGLFGYWWVDSSGLIMNVIYFGSLTCNQNSDGASPAFGYTLSFDEMSTTLDGVGAVVGMSQVANFNDQQFANQSVVNVGVYQQSLIVNSYNSFAACGGGFLCGRVTFQYNPASS